MTNTLNSYVRTYDRMADKISIGKNAQYIESIVQNLTQAIVRISSCRCSIIADILQKGSFGAKFLFTRRYYYSHFSLILVIRLKAELPSAFFPPPPFLPLQLGFGT